MDEQFAHTYVEVKSACSFSIWNQPNWKRLETHNILGRAEWKEPHDYRLEKIKNP